MPPVIRPDAPFLSRILTGGPGFSDAWLQGCVWKLRAHPRPGGAVFSDAWPEASVGQPRPPSASWWPNLFRRVSQRLRREIPGPVAPCRSKLFRRMAQRLRRTIPGTSDSWPPQRFQRAGGGKPVPGNSSRSRAMAAQALPARGSTPATDNSSLRRIVAGQSLPARGEKPSSAIPGPVASWRQYPFRSILSVA